MQQFSNIDETRHWCLQQRRQNRTIGLVPTMGALHEGHLALMRRAKRECDLCIATIFVNPTQFAAGEDLTRYPRPLQRDLELLERENVDAVFLPDESMMYPSGFGTYVSPPPVALPLEGESRPEHFRGVTTVVMKLFQIAQADRAFFGQKDFQQLRVIEDMTRDLNVPIEIIRCDIVRESDGLAMSSRNRYLNDEQRQRALSLSRALTAAKNLNQSGERDIATIEAVMKAELAVCDHVDYAVVVNRTTLLPPTDSITRPNESIALVAARIGNTRLIDNELL
ncbi:pantoate--beta-alanine ligase [Neorhodopirellula pilleata]|uniref:pantoate--beta-alanine ligase n=1 Tax=Neorhodopirellula pilleata TaxID=2714738 RepID=UPI0018CD1EE7|nr:pantoate--beta-alanine ligase [Neorhodopirellula pilleata]